jgi:MFS family permease
MVVAGLSVVAAVITGATVSTISIFAVPLTKEFQLTAREAASLATTFLFGMQLVAPLVGWSLERFGARRVMSSGVLLTVIGYAGIGASHSLRQLQYAFALNGIGVGASTYLPASVVCTNWMTGRRGLAFGVINAASALGTAAIVGYRHGSAAHPPARRRAGRIPGR